MYGLCVGSTILMVGLGVTSGIVGYGVGVNVDVGVSVIVGVRVGDGVWVAVGSLMVGSSTSAVGVCWGVVTRMSAPQRQRMTRSASLINNPIAIRFLCLILIVYNSRRNKKSRR